MAEPFLGEIRMASFTFAPSGWALCNGQLLPINQNQGLFALLGTTYGGDGRLSFGLPNLQGRTPIHVSNSHPLGEQGGEESHTLTIQELPSHTHTLAGRTSAATTPIATGNLPASVPSGMYAPAGSLTALITGSISAVGGSQSHSNMQPYLVLTFIIALQGIFPSRN